jgi:peptide/nickel transport system substrate-binding protein
MKRNIAVLLVAVMVVSSIMLCGCKQNSVSPAKEQVITVGLEQDIGSLAPGSPSCMYKLSNLVYEPLVDLYPDFKKVPGLATSWQASDDGRVWTFALRKGVKFHDGKPFDAEAVKFMINRNKKLNVPKYGFDLVQSMETPDPYTIKFVLSKPSYIFPSDMSMVFNAIVSPDCLDAEGEKVVKAIGTGPFKFESWTKGQEIVLVRNDDYWGQKPKIDKVVFKVMPDPQTRVMALETGQIDLMLCNGLASSQVKELKANKALNVITKTGVNGSLIFFNTYKQPFADVRVRQAISYAIDTAGTVNRLLSGIEVPATHVFAPVFDDFINPDATTPGYKPEDAKKLLKEAGWQDTDNDGILIKNGKRFEVTLSYDTNDLTYRALSEAIQEQLRSVGIEVKHIPIQYNTYYDILPKKNFDLVLVGQWYIPHDEPSNFYKQYFTSKGFYSFYHSDVMDQLVDELFDSIDSAKRIKLHYALQKEIMDNVLAVFIDNDLNVWAMRDNIQGFNPYPGFWHMFKPLIKTTIK